MNPAPCALRLPMRFDPDPLRADLQTLLAEPWYLHPNKADYDRDWSILSLRSIGGHPRRTIAAPLPAAAFADTPNLARTPYFRAVIAAFPMPLQGIRLLKLAAGANITEHTDGGLGFEDGQVRFHIPVITNPEVEFRLAGQRLDMRPGEVWYADFNQVHSVHNRGSEDRIHLVIDGQVNAWVAGLLGRPMPDSAAEDNSG